MLIKLVQLKKSKYFFQHESCVRDSLILFSVFLRQKVTLDENVNFTDHPPGILWIPNLESFGFRIEHLSPASGLL